MKSLSAKTNLFFVFFIKAAEEDSGTETDDETGGPDEGKTNIFFVYLFGKMFKIISTDSVRSSRSCPVTFDVRSCPVRKLIYPVRSSPKQNNHSDKIIQF